MSAGESVGADGSAWIVAAAVEHCEVQCRICDADEHPGARGGITSLMATSPPRLAAAKLFGLTHAQTVNALGIAGTTSAALRLTRAGELSMWKVRAYHAAKNGIDRRDPRPRRS